MISKKVSLFLLILSMFILSFSIVRADNHLYADVEIYVEENGDLNIFGSTNDDSLLKFEDSSYTSKEGKFWTLNFDSENSYSNFYYKMNFPKGTEINYLKIDGLSRIESGDYLSIIAIGESKPINFMVQYSISPIKSYNYLPFIAIPLLIIGTIVILIFIRKKQLKKKSESSNADLDFLTERQKIIYNLIKKNEKMTQTQIKKETGFPKSSVSRNVESLVKKNFLEKKQSGMSNIITLKKQDN